MKNSGFTLVETLIAVTITGFVLATVLGTYWQMIKLSHYTDASRQLQKEVHFALLRMTDKIRAYSVDYDAYEAEGNCGGLDLASHNKLCLNEENVFRTTSGQLQMNGAPLLSDQFQIDHLNFSVSPTINPFAPSNLGNKSAQLQPKVTIFLTASHRNNPKINTTLQTTISSRIYQ